MFRSPGNTDKQTKERKKEQEKKRWIRVITSKLNIQINKASTKHNNAAIKNKQPHQQRLWLRRVDRVVYQSEGR